MIRRTAGWMLSCAIVLVSPLSAADWSNYRGFRFADNIDALAKQAGTKSSEVKLVHQRPARIQELEWRPAFAPMSTSAASAASADPVRGGLLRFYNGELFQIIVTYDRQKIEGLTENDLIDGISATYGPAAKPGGEIPFQSNYAEFASVIARWENPEYSYDLVRTGDLSSFALVLSRKRLDVLARTAITEAARLDAVEAPQRAVDFEKKQQADQRVELDRARSVNKPNFRP